MSRAELSQTLGSIAAIVASYAAAFWLIALPHHDLSFVGRIGYVSAVCCVIGVGAFSWANILALAAKRRHWSRRDCQFIPLLTIIPGCVLFLAGGPTFGVANLILYEELFVSFRLAKLAFPNANNDSPFDRDAPVTLFPK
ncbi:MAG: hypothetical protein WAL95_08970 [Candidatus Acidiferrales bacterium]